jgi:TRAP-type C4-dicarboxylate transport system permease small subunit
MKPATIFDRIIGFLAHAANALIIFLVIVVVADIVASYFLNRPIIWMVEFTGYALVYITFLATAHVLKTEGHVRIDLVTNRLSPRTQDLVNSITSVIGAATCLITSWYGGLATWQYFQLGYVSPTALEIPLTPVVAVIPIGCFLLFIQFVRNFYTYFRRWRTPRQI